MIFIWNKTNSCVINYFPDILFSCNILQVSCYKKRFCHKIYMCFFLNIHNCIKIKNCYVLWNLNVHVYIFDNLLKSYKIHYKNKSKCKKRRYVCLKTVILVKYVPVNLTKWFLLVQVWYNPQDLYTAWGLMVNAATELGNYTLFRFANCIVYKV